MELCADLLLLSLTGSWLLSCVFSVDICKEGAYLSRAPFMDHSIKTLGPSSIPLWFHKVFLKCLLQFWLPFALKIKGYIVHVLAQAVTQDWRSYMCYTCHQIWECTMPVYICTSMSELRSIKVDPSAFEGIVPLPGSNNSNAWSQPCTCTSAETGHDWYIYTSL